jgi:lipoprotein signal peptidase
LTLIPGALDLVHSENPGMAFSLLVDWPARLRGGLLISTAVVGIVVALWVAVRRGTHRLARIGLGLIAGGAAGNLLDRMAGGTVTDFLYLHRGAFRWPVFNVADIAICVGAGLLALGFERRGRLARSGASSG